MRFTSQKDFETFQKINRELVNDVIDTPVVLYKLHQTETQTNSYNESPKKVWYAGVQIPCVIQRDNQNPTEDMETLNSEQTAKFAFLRTECEARGVYPEEGDIIDWDSQYYEVNNTNEVQLWAARTEYRWSIVCEAHLTRRSALQLEKPQL